MVTRSHSLTCAFKLLYRSLGCTNPALLEIGDNNPRERVQYIDRVAIRMDAALRPVFEDRARTIYAFSYYKLYWDVQAEHNDNWLSNWLTQSGDLIEIQHLTTDHLGCILAYYFRWSSARNLYSYHFDKITDHRDRLLLQDIYREFKRRLKGLS